MPASAPRSVSDYAALAASYDRRTRLINAVRLAAVAALELRPGDVALDVACGSGFSFASILEGIGATGQLLAFDHSPELLSIAGTRTGQNNVKLIESGAENVVLPARPNALLFSYTHDVLQSEAALDNLLGQAAAGARVALCGSVLWPSWAWPLSVPVNAWLRARHRRYITNKDNFDRPWAKIAPRLREFNLSRQGPGWRDLARGVLR